MSKNGKNRVLGVTFSETSETKTLLDLIVIDLFDVIDLRVNTIKAKSNFQGRSHLTKMSAMKLVFVFAIVFYSEQRRTQRTGGNSAHFSLGKNKMTHRFQFALEGDVFEGCFSIFIVQKEGFNRIPPSASQFIVLNRNDRRKLKKRMGNHSGVSKG